MSEGEGRRCELEVKAHTMDMSGFCCQAGIESEVHRDTEWSHPSRNSLMHSVTQTVGCVCMDLNGFEFRS